MPLPDPKQTEFPNTKGSPIRFSPNRSKASYLDDHFARGYRFHNCSELAHCPANDSSPSFEGAAPNPFKSHAQIGIVLRGGLSIETPEEAPHEVDCEHWFIRNLDKSDSNLLMREATDIIWIECDAALWQNLHDDEPDPARFEYSIDQLIQSGQCPANLLQQAHNLRAAKGVSPYERLLVHSQVLKILALVLDQANIARSIDPATCPDPILCAARILEGNLADRHSIRQLSRQVHLNEFKLKRGFRERFNETIFGYLRQKRMERALALIRQSDTCIRQIANEVGYANSSHFARAFRATFGKNPKDIQKGWKPSSTDQKR